MLKLIVAAAALVLSTQARAAEGGWSVDWGGGRLYIQGREIAPPLWFTGFGGSVLYANRIQVDPWPWNRVRLLVPPAPEEAARVLLEIDAGDIEAAVAAGAPVEAARDLRLKRGSSE